MTNCQTLLESRTNETMSFASETDTRLEKNDTNKLKMLSLKNRKQTCFSSHQER